MFFDEELIETIKKNMSATDIPAETSVRNIYGVINKRIRQDFAAPQSIANAQTKAQRMFNLISIAHQALLKDDTYSEAAFIIEPGNILKRIRENVPAFRELNIKI